MVKDYRIGEKYTTKEGYEVEIIEYVNSYNCKVKFSTGNTLEGIQYGAILRGEIKNPLHISVYGVGYLGDTSRKERKTIRFETSYNVWRGMLLRCYNEKHHKGHPTYIDCVVTPTWHNYQNFAKWFKENYIEGWQMDKDILVKNNKLYSPETCCFVPKEINILFRTDKECVGIRKRGNRYEATATFLDKSYLGTFDTLEEALNVYKEAKRKRIFDLVQKYSVQLSPNCYEVLLSYTEIH